MLTLHYKYITILFSCQVNLVQYNICLFFNTTLFDFQRTLFVFSLPIVNAHFPNVVTLTPISLQNRASKERIYNLYCAKLYHKEGSDRIGMAEKDKSGNCLYRNKFNW